jgi:hypothetical protein
MHVPPAHGEQSKPRVIKDLRRISLEPKRARQQHRQIETELPDELAHEHARNTSACVLITLSIWVPPIRT